MNLAIGILSFVLVLVCIFLGLLILFQLPKKEAGVAAAFGADTTAALFGAGGGNAMTNLTKWTAGIFVILCILLSWMNAQRSQASGRGIREALGRGDAVVAPQSVTLPGLSNAATSTLKIPAELPGSTPTPVPSPETK